MPRMRSCGMGGKMAGDDETHADAILTQSVGYHGSGRSFLRLLKFLKTRVLTRCERYIAL